MDAIDVLIIDSNTESCRAIAGAVQRMGLRLDLVYDALHGLMMARERIYSLLIIGSDLNADSSSHTMRGPRVMMGALRRLGMVDPTQRVVVAGNSIDDEMRSALDEMPFVVEMIEDPASVHDLVDRLRRVL